MRALLVAALGVAGCATSGAVQRLQADVARLDAEAWREAAMRAAVCQRFEEWQAAHGGVTHACRPQGVSVDVKPVQVFGTSR